MSWRTIRRENDKTLVRLTFHEYLVYNTDRGAGNIWSNDRTKANPSSAGKEYIL